MAIDPRIPLAVQVAQVPARIPDPFERAVKIMSLRDMMQRRELQAQQIQSQVEERELRAQKLREEMAAAERLRALARKYPGPGAGTPENFGVEAAQNAALQGYSPQLIAPLLNPPPEEAGALPEGARYPTAGEWIEAGGPKYGLELWKAQREGEKEDRLAREADFKAKAERAAGWGNIAKKMLSEPGQETHNAGVLQALAQGFIDPQTARQFMDRKWYSPETRAALNVVVAQSIKALDQAKEEREEREFLIKLPGVEAETEKKVLTTKDAKREFNAAKLANALEHSPEAFNAEWDKLPPAERAWFSGATTPDEIRLRGMPVEKNLAETRARQADEDKLWTTPGGLRFIAEDPNRPAHESARARSMLAAAEAQQLRISQARQAGPAAERDETRAQAIGTRWQQGSKLLERYRTIVTNYESMEKMLNGGGAFDLAGLYAFAKAMDPDSVVRESEIANAMKSGNIFAGYLARFKGMIDPHGGFLSPQVKEDFLKAVRTRMDATRRQVHSEHGEIRRQMDVISPGSSVSLYDPNVLDPPGFKQPPGGAGEIVERNGRKFRFLGGDRGKKENWQEVP